ncbi:hypothetical protein GW17_00051836 [Ensete ventricosum]|nr:hypothetical protein GW17_00051836 [Ensete ventricosum]
MEDELLGLVQELDLMKMHNSKLKRKVGAIEEQAWELGETLEAKCGKKRGGLGKERGRREEKGKKEEKGLRPFASTRGDASLVEKGKRRRREEEERKKKGEKRGKKRRGCALLLLKEEMHRW